MVDSKFSWSIALLSLCSTTLASSPLNAGFSLPVVKLARGSDGTSDLTARGSIQDSVQVGSRWYLPVEIGTPAQRLLMLPDSGAPSLVTSNLALNPESYNPNRSATAHQLPGYTYNNCFGWGHCGGGIVYNDTATVGDLTMTMAFEVSQYDNGIGHSSQGKGNFGLNIDKTGMTTKPTKMPTWSQNVLPLMQSGVFTINYNKTNATGTIDFGFIDDTKYTGDIGYTPVAAGGGEWSVQFSGFAAGNSSVTLNTTDGGWLAVVDSGTATSASPASCSTDGYFASVSGAVYDDVAGTYKFPCSTSLPDFVFGIAGSSTYRGVISQEYLIGNHSNTATDGNDGMCLSTLVYGNGVVIFGQNMIESQFVVFDYDNGRVGFANKSLLGSSTGTGTSTGSSSSAPSTMTSAVSSGTSTATGTSSGMSTTTSTTTSTTSSSTSPSSTAKSSGASSPNNPVVFLLGAFQILGL